MKRLAGLTLIIILVSLASLSQSNLRLKADENPPLSPLACHPAGANSDLLSFGQSNSDDDAGSMRSPHASGSKESATAGNLDLWSLTVSAVRAAPGGAPHDAANGRQQAPGSLVRFTHLSLDDGLSQNAGLVFYQDRRGYMWIGTQDGLNRYDGHTFTIYKNDPEDPHSLSYNSVIAITEDQDGMLWIGTWGGGLNRYDPHTEKFTRFQHDPGNPISLSNDNVTSIVQDSAGAIWLGTLGGLDRFDPQTNGFTHFRNDPNDETSLSSDAVSTLFEDSRGALWIGTGGFSMAGAGLDQLDRATGKFTRYLHDLSNAKTIAGDNISSIIEAPDGALWIGTGGFSVEGAGLDRFDSRTGLFTHFKHDEAVSDSLGGDTVIDLYADESGNLWISTWGGGLNRMTFANPGHFDHYRHDAYFPESLSGDEAWALLKDQSGMLWIGTAHSGLNQLPADTGQFQLYQHTPSNSNGLAADAVGAFSEDAQGAIWLATWGSGLDRFDPHTGKFEHFAAAPADPHSLSSNLAMSVYADPQGAIWAATLGGGLNRFDPVTKVAQRYQHDTLNPQSLIGDNVTAILPDGAAGLWLGTFDGLDYLDLKNESFTHYLNDAANPQSLSFNQAVSVFRDRDNQLWVGTWGGGLNRLDLNDPSSRDPKQARFTIYRHDPKNPDSISSDSVWVTHQSPDGTLWFGTQGGLNRFDPQIQKFRAYREKQGLPNDTVLGILEDDEGYLWITTNNGLAKFDPRTEKFVVYTAADGLQSNEFNSNAYFRSRAGTMFIGGVHGFNLFNPQDVKPNPVPPPIAVTRFAVFNQPQDVDLLGQTPIQLSYDQDFISFDFAALDFNAPQKNQYAYKLEGFDQDWVDGGTRPYASYTNLPGGQYVFRVKGSNGDGVWNATGTSLPINITPPVWEMWWFRLLGIVLLIAAIVAAFYWRTRSIHLQKVALEKQVELRTAELQHEIEQRQKAEQALADSAAASAVASERTRLARDLHDAVTQTLFSASLIAEVLPDLWNMNQAEARKRLEELRQLTRGALAEMRTLLVELRPNALVEVPLPVLLRQLSESFIGRARLPVQLNVEGQRVLPPDVQMALYRITQEALNNIVKHAKATQVIITLRLDTPVRLSIVDNGLGFDPATVPPNHLGTKIMRERAQTIGATYSLYSEPGEGTQISVTWEEQK